MKLNIWFQFKNARPVLGQEDVLPGDGSEPRYRPQLCRGVCSQVWRRLATRAARSVQRRFAGLAGAHTSCQPWGQSSGEETMRDNHTVEPPISNYDGTEPLSDFRVTGKNTETVLTLTNIDNPTFSTYVSHNSLKKHNCMTQVA